MRDSENPAGYLTANTPVEITDIWGHKIIRSVNIGRAHGVYLMEAQQMVERARTNNPNQVIRAEFKVSL